MTDLVTPGEVDAEIDNLSAGHAWANAGIGGWIVDGVDISGNYSTIDTTGVSGFTHDATNSLTLTISGGEAYVGGWLVRDRSTDVSVPDASTSTIYVGYDPGQTLTDTEAPADNENVVLGTSAAFDGTMPRTELYEVTASGGTVDSVTDLRNLQPPLEYNETTDRSQSNKTMAVPGLYIEKDNAGLRFRENNDYIIIEPYDPNAGSYLSTAQILYNWGEDYWHVESQVNFRDGLQAGAGVQLHDIAGGSLPSDTQPGRLLYDSSREV